MVYTLECKVSERREAGEETEDMATEIEQAATAMLRARFIGHGPSRAYVQAVVADESYTAAPSQELSHDILNLHIVGQVDAEDGEPILTQQAAELCAAAVRLAWDVVAYRRDRQAQELIGGMVRFVNAVENAHAAETLRLEQAR